MNPARVTTDVLLGLAPIALLILLWQAMVSFGYAPVTLLPPPGQVFARLVQQLLNTTFSRTFAATLFRLFAGFAIAVIVGVTIGLAARRASINLPWSDRSYGSWRRCRKWRFIRAVVAAWFRPRVQDHAGRRGRVVSDSAFDLLRAIDVKTETDLVGDGRGHAAPGNPVQGGAAGGRALDPDPDVASASFISCIVFSWRR